MTRAPTTSSNRATGPGKIRGAPGQLREQTTENQAEREPAGAAHCVDRQSFVAGGTFGEGRRDDRETGGHREGRRHTLDETQGDDQGVDLGRRTDHELSGLVHLSQSALSRLVTGLEKDGLVERTMCADDRRSVFTELTVDGRARYEAAKPVQRAILRNEADDCSSGSLCGATELEVSTTAGH